MSNLQRSFAKAKLANLPFNPPRPLNVLDDDDVFFDEAAEEEGDSLRPLPSPNGLPEDDSSSASSASSVSSTGTIIPSPSQKLFARGKVIVLQTTKTVYSPQTSTSRFAPLPWTNFFAQELFLPASPTTGISHHVYLTAPSSPGAPLFVMHHGAGSSALSFAAVASHILRMHPAAGVLALDARGHGETVVPLGSPAYKSSTSTSSSSPSLSSQPNLSLTLTALSADLEDAYAATAAHMAWPADLPVILVGHSLGGAVVANVAKEGRLVARLLGFAVLDVVEGSAMDALQSMTAYLATRPRSFASVEEGIEWHLRSRTVRTAASARASVPALLKPEEQQSPVLPPVPSFAAITAASDQTGARYQKVTEDQDGQRAGGQNSAHENGDMEGAEVERRPEDFGTIRQRWTWRTDLAATQPFWEDWFVGLSNKFLTARGGKLLLLAGTDRLDKELMIGQMQGKYQLQVFPEAGHFLHEDAPEKTATVLVDFWKRNDGSRLVLPPKVGDLLKQGKKI